MRSAGPVLVVMAAMLSGCAAGKGAGTGASAAAPSVPAERGKDFKVLDIGSGRDYRLRVTVSADTTCSPGEGVFRLESRYLHGDIRLVQGAQTVDEAVTRIDREIAHEFEGFKATGTTALVIAGAPAKHVRGSGTEADDGDPGEADVIVFTVGGRVFLACTHGESLDSETTQWMLAVVRTAQAPWAESRVARPGDR